VAMKREPSFVCLSYS